MKLYLTLKAHISAPILFITYGALSAGNNSCTLFYKHKTRYSRLHRLKVDNSAVRLDAAGRGWTRLDAAGPWMCRASREPDPRLSYLSNNANKKCMELYIFIARYNELIIIKIVL